MPRKAEDIHLRLTPSQKNQLCRYAEIQQKSLSKFMLDAGLAVGTKRPQENHPSIQDSDIAEIKKQLFVLCRLMLYVGSSEQLHNNEEMIRFFQDTEKRAGQLFGGEAE